MSDRSICATVILSLSRRCAIKRTEARRTHPKRKDQIVRDLSDPDLTLQDLSGLADLIPDNVIEDRSRATVDWARTLLVQMSLVCGFLGIKLPQPRVQDGVWLMWYLENAWIRMRLFERPPYTIQNKKILTHRDKPDFSIVGAVSPFHDRVDLATREYLGFSVSGKFTLQFLFAILADWTSTDAPQGELDAPTEAVSLEPDNEDRYGFWVSPDETRDIHEVVRAEFVRPELESGQMEFAGMTLEQMCQLRHDWDGRGSPPPSEETIEWARVVLDNLRHAAEALGSEIRGLEVQVRSVQIFLDSPPEIFVAIGFFLGRNVLEVTVEAAPRYNRVSAVIDFDPDLDEGPEKRCLSVEYSTLRQEGRSPAEILRDVFRQPESESSTRW